MVLSRSDAWAFVPGPHAATIFHFDGTAWQGPVSPPAGTARIIATMTASSDSNVWVFGTTGFTSTPYAARFDGSMWTDESPPFAARPVFSGAVIAKNGDVYVAGSNAKKHTGLIWKFDGTQWADVTARVSCLPAPPLTGAFSGRFSAVRRSALRCWPSGPRGPTEILDAAAGAEEGDRRARLRARAAALGMLHSAPASEVSRLRRKRIIASTRGLGRVLDRLLAEERDRA